MLGFDSVIITNPINILSKMINVILTNKIFIKCNVIEGALLCDLTDNGTEMSQTNTNGQGLHSDVLYSFGNTYSYGYPNSIDRPVKRHAKLIVKKFSEMRISFIDENNLPINFLETSITLTLEIREC